MFPFAYNKDGFTLIESMMGVVILGIAMTAGYGMFHYANVSQKGINQASEFDAYVTDVRTSLSNPANCQSILPNEVFPAVPDADFISNLSGPQRTLLVGANLLVDPVDEIDLMSDAQKRSATRRGFVVRSFRYSDDMADFNVLSPTRYSARIRLRAERYPLAVKNSGIGANEFRPREINVVITVDGTRTPIQCGPVGGGDPPGPAGLQCQTGQVLVGIEPDTNSALCEPARPCLDGQQLVLGAITDEATGEPVLDPTTGEPRSGWRCLASSPADDIPDFIQLCDGGCI